MIFIVFLCNLSVSFEITAQDITRNDFFVESDSEISIFVREILSSSSQSEDKSPILLLHGARVPGIASFDLEVPHGSLAEDLSKAGHPVYIMDGRGYGYSTRSPEMSESPDDNPPLVRSPEVVHDIAAVVEWLQEHRPVDQVALLGWATGGLWAAYYATLYPEQVSHIVLYNTLYGGSDQHDLIGHGSSLEDPDHPGRFNADAIGAYRLSTAESLFGSWDQSIPLQDKTRWRDPDIAEAYAEAALASDSTSSDRSPASFRAPSGALEDSYYIATGRQLWDASLIRSAVLIVRSELDFWSRPQDQETLESHLVYAEKVRSVAIPEATHYVHLDRPERGRDRFIQEVLSFLSSTK